MSQIFSRGLLLAVILVVIVGCGSGAGVTSAGSGTVSGDPPNGDEPELDPGSSFDELSLVVDGHGKGKYRGLEFRSARPFINAFYGPKIATKGNTHLYTRTTDLVDMGWMYQSDQEADLDALPEPPGSDEHILLPEVVLIVNGQEQTLDVGFAGAISSSGAIAYGSLVDPEGMTVFAPPLAHLVVTDKDGSDPQVWAEGEDAIWLPVAWLKDGLLAYDLGAEAEQSIRLFAFDGPESRYELPGSLLAILPNGKIVLGSSADGMNELHTFDLRTRQVIDSLEVPFHVNDALGARAESGNVFFASNGHLAVIRVLPNGRFVGLPSLIPVGESDTQSNASARSIDFVSPHPAGRSVMLISYDQLGGDSSRGELYQCDLEGCSLVEFIDDMREFSFMYEID